MGKNKAKLTTLLRIFITSTADRCSTPVLLLNVSINESLFAHNFQVGLTMLRSNVIFVVIIVIITVDRIQTIDVLPI